MSNDHSMLRLLLFCLLPAALSAQEGWVYYRSGPFEVLTNSDKRRARETLAHVEQLRHVLGQTLAKPELRSDWPIRIVVGKDAATLQPALARDAYFVVLGRNATPAALNRACARILLEASAGRMPEAIERGLLDLFSTLQVAGTRVTLGTPPPAPERNRDWARMHLLSVHENYRGRLRAMLSNLQQGSAIEPAYRNAFEKSPAEIDKETDAWLAAGTFATTPASGRPLDPDEDLPARTLEVQAARVALADALLADPARSREAHAACVALGAAPEGLECLGLLALREKNTTEARTRLAAAVEAGSSSPRAHVELARLVPPNQARPLAEKATKIKPDWTEPPALLADLESDPKKKSELRRKAATLAPREARNWRLLAEALTSADQFGEAARAWGAAERAAMTEQERVSIRQARSEIEVQRVEYEAAEKRRLAEESERELNKLKNAALAEVRAAEARANAKLTPLPEGQKVEAWWDGPQATGHVAGTLQRVDCLGSRARLVVVGDDRKVIQLLVSDPGKVVIRGGGRQSLGCGLQPRGRRVTVDYFPKADAKLGTAGEAAVVEFP